MHAHTLPLETIQESIWPSQDELLEGRSAAVREEKEKEMLALLKVLLFRQKYKKLFNPKLDRVSLEAWCQNIGSQEAADAVKKYRKRRMLGLENDHSSGPYRRGITIMLLPDVQFYSVRDHDWVDPKRAFGSISIHDRGQLQEIIVPKGRYTYVDEQKQLRSEKNYFEILAPYQFPNGKSAREQAFRIPATGIVRVIGTRVLAEQHDHARLWQNPACAWTGERRRKRTS